jgi:hypothetical protein
MRFVLMHGVKQIMFYHNNNIIISVLVKVKLSRYRPGQALGFPGG